MRHYLCQKNQKNSSEKNFYKIVLKIFLRYLLLFLEHITFAIIEQFFQLSRKG